MNINKDKDKATLLVSGFIGIPSFMQNDDYQGIVSTKEDLRKELKAIENLKDVKILNIEIDSYGGDVAHALAIYNILKSLDAEIFVKYIGISASASTVIGSVAKLENISVANNIPILVHEARVDSYGTISDHEITIKDLHTINNSIATTYSNLNGKTVAENLQIMSINNGEGELLTPERAKELGFVGKIIDFKSNNKPTTDNATASIENLKACGWSCQNIERLNKFNNNLKIENMGLFNKEKKDTVLNTLPFGENILIFGKLEKGENVELAGTVNKFTGSFEFQNNTVTVADGEITEVSEISETDKEIETLTAENEDLKTQISELKKEIETLKGGAEKETETKENEVSEIQNEIETLKAENSKLQATVDSARLEVSNPKLPTADFKNDKNGTKKFTSVRKEVMHGRRFKK
ncbi:MAG: hypothetical protein DRI95_00580 [Bacteroidetes bacterium]|nr:MAG: hypothetical protein DRI95_00580 [Bacteroidota bacterium]